MGNIRRKADSLAVIFAEGVESYGTTPGLFLCITKG